MWKKNSWFKKRAEERLDVDEVMYDSFQLRSSNLSWDNRIEPDVSHTPMRILWACILITLGIFTIRVAHIELAQHSLFSAQAQRNAVKEIWEQSPRGIIYSSTHEALVENESSFNLVAIPAHIPEDPEEQEQIVAFLTGVLQQDRAIIEQKFSGMSRFSYRPLLLLSNVPREMVLSITGEIDEIPGIELHETLRRTYPNGPVFSHILGYTGIVSATDLERHSSYLNTDIIGKTGIESTYEAVLRGEYGKTEIETNARGEELRILGTTHPVPGDNLILFLDADLQRVLTDVMQRVMQEHGATRGAAVAVNPRNGGIVAMQSFPLYNNNHFSSRISPEIYRELFEHPDRPLFNRAIAGRYSPGSTLKPFIALAALEEGVVDDRFTINVTGSITVAGQMFRDWRPHGVVDIRRAIAVSSNVFFYTIGGGHDGVVGLGPYRIYEYLSRFLLNDIFSIDIPGERSGFIPGPEWKRETRKESWYVGDTYNISIGQGDLVVTPLGLAMATAAIANEGTLLQPRIVRAVADESLNTIRETRTEVHAQHMVSPEVMRIVREGMRDTVREGSAQQLQLLPVSSAGKTGTAQVGPDRRPNAWFIAFAPYENPSIAIVVLVENAGEGSSVSVPIVREVLEWYFRR